MGMSAPRLERIVQESIRELDELDARHEELRPKPEPANRPKSDTASIRATN